MYVFHECTDFGEIIHGISENIHGITENIHGIAELCRIEPQDHHQVDNTSIDGRSSISLL